MRTYVTATILLWMFVALACLPEAGARLQTAGDLGELNTNELLRRMRHFDERARDLDLDEEARESAARDAVETAEALVRRGRQSSDWYRIGVEFYVAKRYDRLCELWRDRVDELEARDAWPATEALYYLSGARRLTQDWEGTRDLLDRLDRIAARPGLESNHRTACVKVAVSERIKYLLEIGEPAGALRMLPKFDAAYNELPNDPDFRVDLFVRVYRSNGDPLSAIEEVEAYLAAGGELTEEVEFFYLTSKLRTVRIEGADEGIWMERIRGRLETAKIFGRERFQAAYELIESYLAAEDWAGAQWCVADMRRGLAPLRNASDDSGNRDEMLCSAIDTYLAVRSGADRARIERKLEDLLDNYERLLRWLASRPFDESGSWIGYYDRETAMLGALVGALSEIDGEAGLARAVESIARHQTLSRLNRRIEASPCTLEEIRQAILVDDEHGILMLQSAPAQVGGSRILAIDRERIATSSIGSTDAWRTWMQRLVEPFRSAAPLGAEWAALSEAFLDELLPNELRAAFDRWERVTLVGFDGELWFPFEGLDLDGAWLGTVKAVDHLASLPLGVRLVQRDEFPHSLDSSEVLLLAAPSHSPAARTEFPDLEALRLTDPQIASMTSAFPRQALTILRGEAATLDELRARTGPVSLLQILAHGVPSSENDPAPGILLASDDPETTGVLRLGDVPNIPVGIVTLLSCGTGQGRPRVMEGGLNNLAGEFLLRGARAVVVSHEPLLADPTVQLIAEMTASLARGASPAEAMRRARASLVEAGITDPRLHSTLRVWGVGQRPAITGVAPVSSAGPTTNRRILWTILIVAIAIGVLVAVRSRRP